MHERFAFLTIREGTRLLRDDYFRFVGRDRLLQRRRRFFEISWIHFHDVLHAQSARDLRDIRGERFFSRDRLARAGIVLVPRHRRDAVVQDEDRRRAFVVDNVHKAGHAGVEEGGVADDTDDGLVVFGQIHPVSDGDSASHA